METLKNLTLVQWIGIMIGLNSLLMGATPQLTVLFGTAAVPIIVAVATLGNGALGVFVTVIGGLGSQARNVVAGGASIAVGPNASASLATLAMDPAQSKIDAAPGASAAVAAIAKSAAVLLFAFLIVGLAASAHAAPVAKAPATSKTCLIPFDPLKLCGALSGNVSTDIQRVATRIAKISKADLTYAAAKASAANTYASGVRLQCIQAVSDANDQFNGVGLKNSDGSAMVRPDPALATAIEDIAELIDNLSPQGKLMTSCAGFAQMFKTDALTAINGLVTGAVGLATASAVGL